MPAPRTRHDRQQVGHLRNAVLPVLVAGADIARTPQPQIAGVKRTAQRHGPGVRQAAEIFIVASRGQRGTEQHRSAPLGKICRQKIAWVQTEHGGADLTAVCGHLQHKVVVKGVCHTQPCPNVKVELQQSLMCFIWVTMLIEPDFQRLTELREGAIQCFCPVFFKKGSAKAAVAGRFLTAVPPLDKEIVDFRQGVFQAAFPLAEPLFGIVEGAFCQRRAVHIAGAAGQVVRLIQQEDIIARRIKKADEMHDRVKQVVVIAHNHITPEAQVQPQLKRAYLVAAGQRLQGLGSQGVGVQTIPQCLFYSIIVAVGIGARLRRTLTMLLQADLVLGGQGDAAQLECRVGCAQQREGVFCRRPGRTARSQVEHRPALSHSLQRREKHAHRLSDAGGSLTEQVPALGAGLVHRTDHSPLPGPVAVKRKAERGQRGPAQLLPFGGALGPGGIPGQQVGDDGVQGVRCIVVAKAKFQLLIHLIVGQPHPHGGKPLLRGIEGRINLCLCPMLRALLAGDKLRRQRCGLDLIDRCHTVRVGKDAVGTPLERVANTDTAALLPEGHLRLIVGEFLDSGPLQLAVQARTLKGTVKAGKAAVDAAGAQ